jgi:hypothetical protein
MRSRILTMVVCGVFFISTVSLGASISFEQLDWRADAGGYTLEKSDWGKVHVQLGPADAPLLHQQGSAYFAYMNVVTTVPSGHTDNWAVKNHPIYFNSLAELIGRGPESLRFDLGTQPGQSRVSDLQYQVTFDAAPLATAPLGALQQIAVTPVDVIYGGWDGIVDGVHHFGGTGRGLPVPAYNYVGVLASPPLLPVQQLNGTAPSGDGKIKVPESSLPPMNTLPNHCVPEATARSLHYLDSIAPQFSIPETPGVTAARLADLMETSLTNGTTEANYLFGKGYYVSEHHLPIMTTVGVKDFHQAINYLNAGYDVEANWVWNGGDNHDEPMGHVAMVTQIIPNPDGSFTVRYAHDWDQQDGMEGNNFDAHTFESNGALRGAKPEEDAELASFYIECVPEPTTLVLLLLGLFVWPSIRRVAAR